ncbi:MAG: hypothetical protein CMM46_01095 [Rhodospirillaceae bacterium]|nr:hypothetical protein [Rhodospirillaceae bacterium]
MFDALDRILAGAPSDDWRGWVRVPNLLWLTGAMLIVGAPVFGLTGADGSMIPGAALAGMMALGFVFYLLMRVADLANSRDERELQRAQRMAVRLVEERETRGGTRCRRRAWTRDWSAILTRPRRRRNRGLSGRND